MELWRTRKGHANHETATHTYTRERVYTYIILSTDVDGTRD